MSKRTDTVLTLKGDGKGSVWGRWTRPLLCYSRHRDFFSETCLECQANVGEFYSDVLVGTLVWNSRPLGFIRHWSLLS